VTLLQIDNISISFQEQQTLSNISFDVQEGEFVSIVGPSGCGKSTLFHVLGGLFKPDEGDVWLKGKNITGTTGHVSYMPQQISLLPWRNVLDNVLLSQELANHKRDNNLAKKMLKRAGLDQYENAYPDELSGGMKQRVAFVRALLGPQSLLCLDEPFSSLDEFTRLDMQNWLLSMWEEMRPTVLFITHQIDEAILLSDRILVLSPRPATLLEKVEVPFERPRNDSMLLDPEFIRLKSRIMSMIRGAERLENH